LQPAREPSRAGSRQLLNQSLVLELSSESPFYLMVCIGSLCGSRTSRMESYACRIVLFPALFGPNRGVMGRESSFTRLRMSLTFFDGEAGHHRFNSWLVLEVLSATPRRLRRPTWVPSERCH
jgi:hypothetical protein